ncbi:MAG: TIGR02099 family protein [Burkholderiales bacterium]|nr:TIGR02099 family protein [Burkholderiales bacterium]
MLCRALRLLAWVGGGAVVLLALVWAAAVWVLLPRVDEFKPRIEAAASRVIGVPVAIGHIEVRSSPWAPELELTSVTLRDRFGRPALSLPRVVATLSPRSLLALQPRLERLRIESPALEVRRDAAGRITAAGIAIGGPGAARTEGADWLFSQYHVVVAGGSIRWVDEQRGVPPLALSAVEIALDNGLRRHRIAIAATPPPDWGARFTLAGRFVQPLLAPRGDWRRWSGTLEATLPHVDLSQLQREVDLPIQLDRGAGSLHATLTLDAGSARAATADLALTGVALRLARDVEPLALREIAGHLDARTDAGGVTLAARHLAFVTDDGLRWPAGDLDLTLLRDRQGAVSGGSFAAARIDLALASQLAARVPLGAPLRRALAAMAPQGLLSGFKASWTGAVDAPRRYRAAGGIDGLALKAAAVPAAAASTAVGRPGLAGAQIRFDASESGGTAQIAIAHGSVDLPGVWSDPLLPLDNLQAQASWQFDGAPAPGVARPLAVQLKIPAVANADFSGGFTLAWHSGAAPARYPGLIQIDGKLARADAARVPRYLPLAIPASVRSYLDAALRRGRISGATFHVRGDLRDFPWAGPAHAKDSEFHIEGQLADGVCDCIPAATAGPGEHWPAFEQVQGRLVFDRDSMALHQLQARVGALAVTGVEVGIAGYVKGLLAISGRIDGMLADELRYVDATPVGRWIGGALAQARGGGPAGIDLALAIPLANARATQVRGQLTLDHDEFRFRPDLPPLADAQGRIAFTEQGWSVQGGRAQTLGGTSLVEGGTEPDGALRLRLQGQVSVAGLRAALGPGTSARMLDAASGQTTYRGTLVFAQGRSEVALDSDLVGIALALPAPLAKVAAVALPLHLRNAYDAQTLAPGRKPRDGLQLDLGDRVHARYQRERDGDAMQVLRGAIGIGEPAVLPATGVEVRATLPLLDAEAWQQASAHWFDDGGAGAATAGGGVAATDAGGAGAGYAPTSVQLRAQALIAGPVRASQVHVGATRVGADWHLDVDAARLRLRDIELGQLLMRGEHRAAAAAGQAGTWQLSQLRLTQPKAHLDGKGAWVAGAGGALQAGHADLDFKLELDDSGATLAYMGMPQTIKGGKGEITGRLSWPGPLWSPELPRLSGQLHLAIAEGQFLKADPGAARLLSILSLQTLPRRLLLDFRDLFDAGFAFDDIGGDVAIAAGVATAHDLRMRGAQAVVLIDGSADLVGHTQDLHVAVIPEINAGTASLAYAAVNPVLGLGTFLAQLLLRKPLMRAATREFHITGTWADPKTERVETAAAASAPAR